MPFEMRWCRVVMLWSKCEAITTFRLHRRLFQYLTRNDDEKYIQYWDFSPKRMRKSLNWDFDVFESVSNWCGISDSFCNQIFRFTLRYTFGYILLFSWIHWILVDTSNIFLEALFRKDKTCNIGEICFLINNTSLCGNKAICFVV